MDPKKLYVGNLSWNTTDDTLRAYFEGAGAVESATVMKDKFTGRSKGFAFVVMADEAGATKAIEMFHEKEFEGRNLIVNVARPLEDRPPRRDFGGAPRAGGFGGGQRRDFGGAPRNDRY